MTETGTSSGRCIPRTTFGALPMTPTAPNPASGAARSSGEAARTTESVRDGTVGRGGPAGRRRRIPGTKNGGITTTGISGTRSAGTATAPIPDTTSRGGMAPRPAGSTTPLATADIMDPPTGVIPVLPA